MAVSGSWWEEYGGGQAFTVMNSYGLDSVEGRAPKGRVAMDLPSRLMIRLTILLMVLWATVAYSGNPLPDSRPDLQAKTWHFRWAYQDNATWWKYTAYWPGKEVHTSWVDHGVGSFGLYQFFKHNRKMSKQGAFLWTFGLGVAWETKDALIPHERWGKWGGDGFSSKDLVKDLTGIGSAMLFNYITEKRKK